MAATAIPIGTGGGGGGGGGGVVGEGNRDASHLCKCFRARFHFSPGAYRKFRDATETEWKDATGTPLKKINSPTCT
ncbi:hypothetical protein Ga0100231_001455 [Opitutaceae bacterium TAV4]|nr:hypothetical protein Ga0100231_001455 [Opitutaceae bacterium TAV4]